MVILLSISACSDKTEVAEVNPDNPSSVTEVLNRASVEWGKSSSELISYMKGYNQVAVGSSEMLQFKTPKGSQSISYQLHNGGLCATAILLPTGSTEVDLSSLISGYTYVGDLSGGKVYENLSKNTMATVWQPTENDSAFTAVGFAPITSEAYEVVSSDTDDEADYVDLGLSVKWATCNLGAVTPDEYGDYYAWAETKTRQGDAWNYNWTTAPYYKSGSGRSIKFSKYNWSDKKVVLDAGDDAATVILGNPWRMPTIEEANELVDKCTWECTSVNGVSGCKVTGSNGNSIFLPFSGRRGGNGTGSLGVGGYYWTSSKIKSSVDYDNAFAKILSIFKDGPTKDRGFYRYAGATIRPVRP